MITDQLKNLVREEASNLREKATREELDKLDFMVLDVKSSGLCVYGQMTGDCYSQRAGKLIRDCCKKVIGTDKGFDLSLFGIAHVGRKSIKEHGQSYHSPIEVYITKEGAKNANLISYLKGETETLDL